MFHTLIICNLKLVLEPWTDFWLLYPKNHSPVPSSLHLPWDLPSPGGHLDPCSPHSCHGFMPSFFEYRHWELHRIFLYSTSSISLSAQGTLCLLQRDEPALNLCSFKSFADTWYLIYGAADPRGRWLQGESQHLLCFCKRLKIKPKHVHFEDLNPKRGKK